MSRQALKRRGEPEEFADLVSFHERASGLITGQTIRIDGGWVTTEEGRPAPVFLTNFEIRQNRPTGHVERLQHREE
ncbi:hypothetical protein F2981_00700 [Sinorhizobium meliloti]|nr:hypothetical protein [Sinorhizobium meliloti]